MRRSIFLPVVLTQLTLVGAILPAAAQTPAEYAQTASYAAAHQNKDGGFAATSGQLSSLGATNSGLRVLKHVGGSVPDILGCIKYVKSCRDAESGGFAPMPGGKPDVVTTAIGLMAASELKIANQEMTKAASDYFSKNAKSFEEVRMAIAGLEAVLPKPFITGGKNVDLPSPDFLRWNEMLQGMRKPDGTWGEGPDQAYATGGAGAAVLRMGLKLDKRDAVVAALKSGQRPEGGWSKDAGPPDLGATYRIMRALFMLHERPDIERLLAFIARCRQSDGSYASKPGDVGSLAGTYTATIVIYWVRQLLGVPTVVETAGLTPLVSGKDLTGWEGDTKLWSNKDGMLIGRSPGINHNEFLSTTATYGDFVLSLYFRMIDGKGNSGVQFRSVRIPHHEMSGYQADIGEGYWASLYDESRRNKVLVSAREEAIKALNKTDWNHYVVSAAGGKIVLSLNGKRSVEYHEPDAAIARSGLLAVQIHAGGPMEVQFKDMMIQSLPIPKEDNTTTAGFHLRTVKTDQGERKYSLYVPESYDGSRVFPVILFLHGSGERGEDGITPAQAGIGPAIVNRPHGVPALVVFPQARRTWSAGSDDSTAALAALDDVMKHFSVDPQRVILTGLSMGGRGTWELAAAHPERFAAVVPICGSSKTSDAAKLKTLPIWTFCGDADREQTVLGMRSMVEALQHEGATPRITEYRGVGHLSWDRVYNDPEVIDWMLNQRKP
jgi:predicted esterase